MVVTAMIEHVSLLDSSRIFIFHGIGMLENFDISM